MIINYSQYAFHPKSSTISAAYDLTSSIQKELDHKKIVVVVYIDMKNAFDTVSKNKLIEKLQHYGFKEKELNIIKSYIFNRQQMTKVNNYVSDSM